jgi:hypothetical protein
MSKLSVLMTVYNEADFVEYAIRACLPHVDHLVIVEGAYQETIDLGAEPRSTDGTIEVITETLKHPPAPKMFLEDRLYILEANEKTDKDQRNIGLEKIKELNPDGWLLIIDGDEVYEKNTFSMIKILCHTMDKQKRLAAYFKSLTFVNDFCSFTEQEFPRLFKITPECKFCNDNFMEWSDLGIDWFSPYILKIPYVKYYHYAFCKGLERFEQKKKWWETRFGEPFDYGWKANENGKISDSNHVIREYTGEHPVIMKGHSLWRKSYGC